ncbi:hypothetical protein [Aliicoccus persicus]|uniref:hypothetical protein n=1 Tax=Aliicoccus persicus TaxID=930138 RepID=UPI000B86D0F8|nr:hypothetical protein [Aliicoccus persicus]
MYSTISSKIFKYIADNYDEKLLSLSGGGDSRISMALSKEVKNQIIYFTYVTNAENDQSTSIKREAHKDYNNVNQIV